MRGERYDIFISHASEVDGAAVRIAEKLREAGFQPWIDNWNCAGGGRFQQEIDEGIEGSRAFAVLIGPTGISNWVAEEIEIARSLAVKNPSFRLFVVMLPGYSDSFDRQTIPATLRNRGWVDFRKGYENDRQFQAIIDAIQGRAPGPPPAEPGQSPYRGLEVFDEAHADFYFGREVDIDHLVGKLKDNRFLAVVGPSGSGKSSLVRAGLIPALRTGRIRNSERWSIAVIRPGAHPLASLAAELIRLDPSRPMGPTLDRLEEDSRTLDHASLILADPLNPHARLVLIVDQFEEVFTLCDSADERRQYIDNLHHAATVQDGRCMVVITMRADFYARCAAYSKLAALVGSNQVLIGPLDRDGLRAVIVEPAHKAGLQLEPGLEDVILEDVERQPGALPLLEHALLELWKNRHGNLLTLEGYRASDGVSGAIAKTAESEFAALTPDEQVVARRMFLRLTEPGEGTEDTRRRARMDELAISTDDVPRVETVVDRLVAARLITASVADDIGGHTQVDVAHEALIRGWPRLKFWIDEDRAGLRIQRRITNDSLEWQRRNYDEDSLYRGARLLEANEFAHRPDSQLNELETSFIGWGNAIQGRERAEVELRRIQKERTQRRWMAGLATAAVLSLLLGLFAWQQRGNAIDDADSRATAEAIAVAAQSSAEANEGIADENADAYATEAARAQAAEAESDANANAYATEAARAQIAEAESDTNADAHATEAARALTAEAESDENAAIAEVNAQAYAAAAAEAAAAEAVAEDERAFAIAQQSTAEASAQESKARELAAVAASDDVRIDQALLAAIEASDLGSEVVPEYLIPQILLNEPRFLKTLTPPNPAADLDYDFCLLPAEGRYLIASLSSFELVVLWDHSTSEKVAVLGKDEGRAGKQGIIACDPSGRLIATAATSRSGITIWDVENAVVKYRIPELDLGELWSLSFSPSGEALVIGTENGVFFWSVEEEREILPHDIPVVPGMFAGKFFYTSDTGKSMVIGGQSDGSITFFDVTDESRIDLDAWNPAIEFLQPVNQIALSNDGEYFVIVTTSLNPVESGWLWQARIVRPNSDVPVTTLEVQYTSTGASADYINDIAISADNNWIALASTSGETYLYKDNGSGAFEQMERLDAIVRGYGMLEVAFMPGNAALLVSRTGDGVIALWDLDRMGPLASKIPVSEQAFPNIDSSADGALVAVVGCFGDLAVWSVPEQRLIYRESVPRSTCWEAVGFSRVAVSREGELIAVWRSGGEVALFDVASRRFLAGATGSNGVIGALRFSGDGQWLFGADANGVLHRWSVDGQALTKVDTTVIAEAMVAAYAWSPEGQYLVVETVVEIRAGVPTMVDVVVWDMADLSRSWDLPVDYGDLRSNFAIGVSDDASVLAARFDGMIIKWTRDERGVWSQTYAGFNKFFLNQWWAMRVLEDDSYVGISGFGNRVSVFDGDDLPVLSWQVPFGTEGGSVVGTSISVSEDGGMLVTGHRSGVVVWNLDDRYWRDVACESAGRNFTLAEWQQFFGETPYRRTCEQFPSGWGAPPVTREDLALWN